MAKSTTLRYTFQDLNGNTLSKSVSNANTAASNYTLRVFAEKLNSLTKNTFVAAYRVDEENITYAAQGE